ncbi:DNA repair protein RadA, partial [Candidatus Bathyarchaeota archaeon]
METRRPITPTLQQNDERAQTGIPSLDKIIEGGLARGDTIIVAGQPGTG